jgi:polyhydroxyalkanoate synthesis regulator phasin
MKTLLEKSLILGLGTLSFTKEKAENFLKELEERGEVTTTEAKKLLGELMEKGEQEKSALKQTIQHQVSEVMKNLGYVQKEDYSSLEDRVKDLEARLGNIPQ